MDHEPESAAIHRVQPIGRSVGLDLRLLVAGLIALLAALATLVIVQGLAWLDDLRAQRRQELQADVTRGHEELLARLRDLHDAGWQHARYLARAAAVRRFLDAPVEEREHARAELSAQLLPYLLSFDPLDRVCVTDADGVELYRCERMGGGAGALPPARLGRLDPALLAAARPTLVEGGVHASALEVEAHRVEVRTEHREVFHYVTTVTGTGRAGHIALTVYASPSLSAVRAFAPLPGTRSALIDAGGLRWLAPSGPVAAHVPPAHGAAVPVASHAVDPAALADRGDALDAVAPDEANLHVLLDRLPVPTPAGARPAVRIVDTPHGVGWIGTVHDAPPVTLVTWIPLASLVARGGPWQQGGARVLASMVAAMLLVGLVSIAVLNLNRRAWRQHEAEQILALSRREAERQRRIIEQSADMIILAEPLTRRILEANLTARRTLPAALPDQPIDDLLEEEPRARLVEACQAAHHAPGTPQAPGEFTFRGPGGTSIHAEARCVVLDLPDGPSLLLSLRDRTRERAAEQRLAIAERLSSLGLLTAGVAHEINNPLEGIGNYLSLLAGPHLDEGKRAHYLAQVAEGFRRIRDLVRDLLTLGRDRLQVARMPLRSVIERSVRLARMSERLHEVTFELSDVDPGLQIAADSGRLQQVLLNLFLNAATAMDGKGCIRVTIARTDRGEIQVRIEDTGPGIPAQHLAHIFDPFFTTSAQGTGLGLFIAYTIVQAHGGQLLAHNLPDRGACFTLQLPGTPTRDGVTRESAAAQAGSALDAAARLPEARQSASPDDDGAPA